MTSSRELISLIVKIWEYFSWTLWHNSLSSLGELSIYSLAKGTILQFEFALFIYNSVLPYLFIPPILKYEIIIQDVALTSQRCQNWNTFESIVEKVCECKGAFIRCGLITGSKCLLEYTLFVQGLTAITRLF